MKNSHERATPSRGLVVSMPTSLLPSLVPAPYQRGQVTKALEAILDDVGKETHTAVLWSETFTSFTIQFADDSSMDRMKKALYRSMARLAKNYDRVAACAVHLDILQRWLAQYTKYSEIDAVHQHGHTTKHQKTTTLLEDMAGLQKTTNLLASSNAQLQFSDSAVVPAAAQSPSTIGGAMVLHALPDATAAAATTAAGATHALIPDLFPALQDALAHEPCTRDGKLILDGYKWLPQDHVDTADTFKRTSDHGALINQWIQGGGRREGVGKDLIMVTMWGEACRLGKNGSARTLGDVGAQIEAWKSSLSKLLSLRSPQDTTLHIVADLTCFGGGDELYHALHEITSAWGGAASLRIRAAPFDNSLRSSVMRALSFRDEVLEGLAWPSRAGIHINCCHGGEGAHMLTRADVIVTDLTAACALQTALTHGQTSMMPHAVWVVADLSDKAASQMGRATGLSIKTTNNWVQELDVVPLCDMWFISHMATVPRLVSCIDMQFRLHMRRFLPDGSAYMTPSWCTHHRAACAHTSVSLTCGGCNLLWLRMGVDCELRALKSNFNSNSVHPPRPLQFLAMAPWLAHPDAGLITNPHYTLHGREVSSSATALEYSPFFEQPRTTRSARPHR